MQPRNSTLKDRSPKKEARDSDVSVSYDYDAIPIGYYDEVFQRRRGVQSKWHHLKFKRFRDHIAGCRHHLDIGCGPGTFIGSLGDDIESTGVDIAENQIDFANRRYGKQNKRFIAIPDGALPFPDGYFDVVTAVELVEHLAPEQNAFVLKEAVRTLRVGGKLLVSTPNYGGSWPLVETIVNRFGKVSYAEQHITHFNQGRLEALLKLVGLERVSVEGYMFAAPFAAVLGWKAADMVEELEPALLVSRFGLLLMGTGTKHS